MHYICFMVNQEKNLSIETLRGIAILLVVVGHVIGSGPGGGMKFDFPHPLRYLYVWIDYIQMPLFTAIAGLCVEAFLCIFRFWKFCPEESFASAGADGGGGHVVFSGTVSDAGH